MRSTRSSKRTKLASIIVLLLNLLLLDNEKKAAAELIEDERIEQYHAREHTWPPQDINPDTTGWHKLMFRRFLQLERVVHPGDKYNGFVSTVHSAITCPNFTENGWGLTRAPQGLVDDLVKGLHRGLVSNPPLEPGRGGECIESQNRPLFVEMPELNDRAVRELHPIVESWSGVKLIGNNAYGLRIYRNDSNLNMHVDKHETHVLSAILHVDHDPLSEPWPIVIEDFQGNTNEVVLESGDMLLYESSKCLHGRPRKFNGAWYTSLFIHYYPIDWADRYSNLETHFRIPPGWDRVKPLRENLEELVVIDTSMKEPACTDSWCELKDSLKWSAPKSLNMGMVLSAGGEIQTLDLPVMDVEEL